jgi:hypothetical protein
MIRVSTPPDRVGLAIRQMQLLPITRQIPGGGAGAIVAALGLVEVVDRIDPIGDIMAGDWRREAPRRKTRELNQTSAARVSTVSGVPSGP